MRLLLALAIGALSGCGKESKKAAATAVLGAKYEKISGSLDFLSDGGLDKLEFVPTGTPHLDLKFEDSNGLLAPLNRLLFEPLDISKDLDRVVTGLAKPVFEKLNAVNWNKAKGGMGLRDDDHEFALLRDTEYSIELPSAAQSPSYLTIKSDPDTATLWLKIFWPAAEETVEKGLEFGVSQTDSGTPRLAVLYDMTRLAQLTGMPAEDCAGAKVQLRFDLDEAPKLRVDFGECAGTETLTKSLWIQKAVDGFRLGGRITSNTSLVFQLATNLETVPHLVGDIAFSQQSEISNLSTYMTENGLGNFLDRYVTENFWNAKEEASATNIAPIFCELESLTPADRSNACSDTKGKGVIRPLLIAQRDKLPVELQGGVDEILNILELSNPIAFASALSFGQVPADLAPLEAALRLFQTELSTDTNYMAGSFVPEILPIKELPKKLF